MNVYRGGFFGSALVETFRASEPVPLNSSLTHNPPSSTHSPRGQYPNGVVLVFIKGPQESPVKQPTTFWVHLQDAIQKKNSFKLLLKETTTLNWSELKSVQIFIVIVDFFKKHLIDFDKMYIRSPMKYNLPNKKRFIKINSTRTKQINKNNRINK